MRLFVPRCLVPYVNLPTVVAPALLLTAACVTFPGPVMYSHGSMDSFTTTPTGQPDRFSHENPTPGDPKAAAEGAEVFQKHCAECHGDGGRGDGPAREDLDGAQPADLVKMVGRRTDGELYGLIAYGRPGMPVWRDVLTERELWNLVNHLRQNFGKKAGKK